MPEMWRWLPPWCAAILPGWSMYANAVYWQRKIEMPYNVGMQTSGDVAAAHLQRAIAMAFPLVIFRGAVTPVDDKEWAEVIDDELDLRDNLRGHSWNEVPPELIDRQAGGLPLLTPEAFAVFLPAWLVRSLERLDGKNEVREYTVYDFCPNECSPLPGDVKARLEEYTRIRHEPLNREQRKVVYDFLALVSSQERDKYLSASADSALSHHESWNSQSVSDKRP